MNDILACHTGTAAHKILAPRGLDPAGPRQSRRRSTCVALIRPVAILLAVVPTLCSAHHRPVHMSISQSAALSSGGLQSFLSDYFGAQGSPLLDSPPLWLYGFPGRGANTTDTPIGWIKLGSNDEDDWPRFGAHFYTVNPVRQPGQAPPGLTDASELLGLQFLGVINSFVWASVRGQLGPRPPG